ncbi:MAG: threonine aldolase family protein [Candidatus Binatia bacterium]
MIDLRSDTVTQPTPAMREAMARAKVGDDAREGDPTTRRLEEAAARLLGLEAGLYVPSGTMANLVAVIVHTSDRKGVVLEANSHIATVELGSFTNLTDTALSPVHGSYGVMASADVEEAFRQARSQGSPVGVLCLENTHNNAGGTIVPQEDMRRLIDLGHDHSAAVHVDGARIFNAEVALGKRAAELVQGTDSAMFCVSKGLGAPIGSVLCGSREFIARAKQVRMWCGGTMRQSGMVAAAGLVALQDYPARFHADHANAQLLAAGLSEHLVLRVDTRSVQTNMVYVRVSDPNFDPLQFERFCYERKVWVRANKDRFRFVLHHQVSSSDVDEAIKVINSFSIS